MIEEWVQELREAWEEPLVPVTTGQLAGVAAAAFVLFWVELASEDGWVPILDSLNLVFHEAGHPIFGIFGHTVGFLGGTLGQLLVPLLVAAACWHKRHAGAIALSGLWFFQNFLNIARYMADARAQLLPLVGGGEHDWNTLFGEWGILAKDVAIARVVSILGWAGMLGCLTWLAWRWFAGHQRQRRGPEA